MLDPSAFTPPYDHYLCSGLETQGCDVRLLTTEGNFPKENSERAYTLDRHYYSYTNRLFADGSPEFLRLGVKGTEHVYDTGRLLQKLRATRPDVIHFQWLPLPVVDQLSLPMFRRIAPLVFTVHDSNPFHGAASSRLQLLGADRILSNFDHLVTHTEFTKRKLIDEGIPEERISKVPHGVLPYPPSPTSMEKNAENRILFFGTLKPYKGIQGLLQAFADLPCELRDETELYIAGRSGMPVAPLQRFAVEMGIGSEVIWDLRYIPDDEIAALFESADVIAFPYREIDQSGALMTALQFGKPIVATEVGGFPEVLNDGMHGRLVSEGDMEEFGEALTEILRDPQRAEAMGSEVRSLAETTYSWKEIATRTIEVYKSVQ